MQNFKKRLQTNFTTIDNRIAQSNLSYEARGLYFYMQSLPDDWRFSEERLARAGGIGIDKIKRILKELFSIGLLTREITKDDKGHNLATYTLFDFDTIKNPTLENPPLENPTLENPMYYKEIYSTKKKENKEIKKTNTRTRTRSAREHDLDFLLDFAKAEFEKANPIYFSLDDFLEWVEFKYHLFKQKKRIVSQRAIKMDFNKLLSFNDKALESLEKTINKSWDTFYPIDDDKNENKPVFVNSSNNNASNTESKYSQQKQEAKNLCEKFLQKIQAVGGKLLHNGIHWEVNKWTFNSDGSVVILLRNGGVREYKDLSIKQYVKLFNLDFDLENFAK